MFPLPVFILVCLLVVISAFSTGNPGRIEVTAERTLTGVSTTEAMEAWQRYTFERGGGVPGVVVSEGSSRLLLPLMARETLVESNQENEVRYKLTELGPIWSLDIEPDSHVGKVHFEATGNDEVKMTWTTSFEAHRRRDLWQSVAETMIGLASDNLVSYLSTPRLYTKTTILPGSLDGISDKWVDFVFRNGGGLPLLPPLVLPSKEYVADILRIPPFLRETVVSQTDREIIYQVQNPGWLTCFPVHSHLGRVRLVPISDDSVEMIWQVEVRPLRGGHAFVETFTETIVSTISRNFKVHLSEPDATVSLYKPRGGGKSWAKVRKDSWLGGVLNAHLSDHRSTLEQTISMLQPWTWGRTRDWDEEGEESRWETAAMDKLDDRSDVGVSFWQSSTKK